LSAASSCRFLRPNSGISQLIDSAQEQQLQAAQAKQEGQPADSALDPTTSGYSDISGVSLLIDAAPGKTLCTDNKENQIFFIFEEIQMGNHIYEEAFSHI
jgi:hypothetical protein